MVEATLFIPLIIVAITQMIKMIFPQVTGFLTIMVAFAVGIVVALIDVHIGVENISVAAGLICALGAIGLTTVAGKASNQ